MKESTIIKMQRDIRNLSITLAIVLERIKQLEGKNQENAPEEEKNS
jgi:hypothetical protein